MPQTEIRVFRSGKGEIPVYEFLRHLRTRFPKAHAKVLAAIGELAQNGNQLREPLAKYLEEGIFELRVRLSKINYRVLYGFSGRNIAILTNGFTKEDTVPPKYIDTAIRMMDLC